MVMFEDIARHCFCMSLEGPRLTESDLVQVHVSAQSMLEQEKNRLNFKGDDCEGCVMTKFKAVAVGSLVGIEFTARFDRGSKSYKATFICKRVADWRNVKTAFAEVLVPCDDLPPEYRNRN